MTHGPMRESDRAGAEPVFLLAPSRSYSTVTLALMSGHPDVYGFPELLIFTADTVGELLGEQTGWARPLRKSGLWRAVADLHEGSQEDDAVARAQAWLSDRPEWPTTRLMDHLIGLARPRISLEKSPDTSSSDATLARCMAAYPRARFLHLVRHPVTTQRSIHDHWRPAGRFDSEEALIAEAAAFWYLSHQRIIKALAPLPSQQWMRVRAEDLLTEPRVWLPRILAWLELDSNTEIIDRMLLTENWRFAGTGRSGRLLGGDPMFLRAPALRPIPAPGPVVFDPSWGLRDEMCEQMTVLARSLGY
ncbi:sulfotransferase family protein [Actinomadura sp. HBU206391]|uniref:sulfotransferase family protein n=1 Tax=Actinomadura sp. HBU206391 TaxID=2731692 RepID=UPI00164F9326|nr:sulfotransferase [Actinomadura sp. HBU206391]MBC6459717.1 sulfotransferase [Actinomadura sp. HBU206391]